MPNTTICPCPSTNSNLVDITTIPAVVIFPVVIVVGIVVVKNLCSKD